jgi:hypothetical protein
VIPLSGSIARTTDKPARQSLCCVCGALRTVSANYAPRGRYTSAGDDPGRIAQMQESGGDYWRDRRPWRRCLENLKCSTCGTVTEHAMVFADSRGDWNEERDAEAVRECSEAVADVDTAGRELGTTAGQLAFLGCTIVMAPDEHHTAINRLLRPGVDAGAVGPVILLSATNSADDVERYLRRALDHLLGRPWTA